jgi:acyl carrier protein
MSRNEQIREVLAAHGKLAVDPARLDDEADLYAVGLESHSAVSVMLALEEEFSLEFPDDRLRRSTFSSIAALSRVIAELKQ